MRANPTVIGAFVVGAVVLAVGGVLLFGSGEYFQTMEYYVMFFEDDVDGLVVGSPVKLEGVRIGEVCDVHLEWNVEQGEFRVPVTIEVPEVQGTAYGGGSVILTGTMEERLEKLVDRGLRASLATQSIITGKLAVVLDFHPDTPVNLVGGELSHPEIPTVRTGLSRVMEDLSEIPFKQIFLDLQQTIQNIDGRVQSEEVTRAINSVSESLDEFRKLGDKLNEKVGPLVDNLDRTSTEARETFQQVTETIRGVEKDVNRVSASLDETLVRVRTLVDDVDAEVKPTAEDLRQSMEELRATLQGIDGAAKKVSLLLRDDSPAITDLKRALLAIADAARAVEALSKTLEKQPESIVRGKRGG